MFENAKEYLARVVPWPEPGETGYVNLHWTFPPPVPRADGKPAWSGQAVTSMHDAERALNFAAKPGSNTQNIYACMSLQSYAIENPPKGKRKFTTWKSVRSAENAIRLKSFFIDIDLKDGPKGYATPEELLVALNSFIDATGLPRPTMVVSTGGGFHIYWCFDRALTPAEWLPHAFALANATRVHGLKCDTQCTVDSVRVLRIPDTYNYKYNPPKPVKFIGTRRDFDYSLSRLTDVLDRFKTTVPHSVAMQAAGVDHSLFPRRAANETPSDLATGLDDLFPPVDLDNVALRCGFIADALATGGAALDNPLWNLTTLISTFTKGGRADAHRLGCKHATYVAKETDDFFDRKDRERTQRRLGWPACASVSAAGAKACGSCPLLAQNKSPLNFTTQVAGNAASAAPQPTIQSSLGPLNAGAAVALHAPAQHVTLNDLPANYVRDANNVVSKVLPDPNNPGASINVPISDYPIMDAWLQKDPHTLHFDSIVERNRVSQIDILLENVATTEMRRVLQGQGFMLASNDKYAGEFFVSWIKKLQSVKDAVASTPFGWQNKHGSTEGFVFGGRMWTPSGDEPAASANPVLNQHYKPKGDDTAWRDAVKLVTLQGRPDLEAIVASAFAAPLVMFTGHNGMLMSAYSKESGIGKTTASKIAQSVWGDPVAARQSLSDTYNSVMSKIGQIRSLPLYWDELKSEDDTKRFVNITFQISEGREKSRLNQHAQLKEPGQWQTLVISTSNDSLVDHVTAQTQTTLAGMYRIFEYRVLKVAENAPGQIPEPEATMRLAKLNNNYGAVGLNYARWLGQNFAQVEQDMRVLSTALVKEVSALKEERFWTSLISCLILGAHYANKIGYGCFDELTLKTFLIQSLDNMRSQRSSQTVDLGEHINTSSILASFLKDMQRENKVIVTNRIHVSAGRPPAATSAQAIKVIVPADVSRVNGVVVQIGHDDKLMRISSSGFGEWLKKQGKSRHHLMEALHAQVSIKPVKGFLASGTGLSFTKENLLEIDLASSNELNFIDQIQ
jgi:hypothetical protein